MKPKILIFTLVFSIFNIINGYATEPRYKNAEECKGKRCRYLFTDQAGSCFKEFNNKKYEEKRKCLQIKSDASDYSQLILTLEQADKDAMGLTLKQSCKLN